MGETTIRRHGYRSLFWPIVLIAVGVIWILGNVGVISAANLIVLFRLWQLLLIVVGLDLLFGRQSPVLGGLIALGAVVLIVALMLVGPSLGLAGEPLDVTLDHFDEPRGAVTSAEVQLDLSVATTTITSLADSPDLITAEVSHVGQVEFSVDGETHKVIHLSQISESTNIFQGPEFLGTLFGAQDDKLYWNIALDPTVPLTLDVNGGVGESHFDLSKLQLQALSISGGVGEFTIAVSDTTAVDIHINGGVGQMTIDVPDGAAVHLEGKSGVGSINVPASLRQVSSNDSNFVGDSGVWESDNYAGAARRITITYEGGVGGLTIQ